MGIGIGLIIAASIMAAFGSSRKYSDAEIEQRAREMGMEYSTDFKVINKDVKK
ncbi:MAG: hypothetical protein Q8930_18895 [Bacillota bacterium]|nr:hypothetical protein [Bacillota bacterium]